MYFVYVLTSTADAKFSYVGCTNNLKRRLTEHDQGKMGVYSNRYKPWQMTTYVAFSDKKLAVSFERYLKSGSGHAFLKRRLLPK
ncbi:MAG: GIY-YIG nuclease family protein [Candidatus Omnitrophica bacterium]|nr:GIY-YIG nuclease family protein [Candidatus Omnitrophota bacterium]